MKAADRLNGYFPRGAASDPEVFLTGLVQLMATYPAVTIESALSPISGLPAKFKFMPSIAEIREDLDERYEPYRRRAELERETAQRKMMLAPPDTVLPRGERPSLDDLRAKHGPNWGIKGEEDTEAAKKRKAVKLEHIAKANDILLHKEYMAAGRDIPASEYAASPSLAKLLHDNPVPMKRGGGREPL